MVAFEGEYAAGFADPALSHDRSRLSLSLSGVMTVATDGANYVLPPRRAIWIPARERHRVACRESGRLLTLYIEPHLGRQPERCRVFATSPLVRALSEEVALFGTEYRSEGREGAIVRLLMEEIGRMSCLPTRIEIPRDDRLRRICEAIVADPADSRGLKEWAGIAGMGRRTFTRLFRKQTGAGFAAWRREVRLIEAISRLVSGQSITCIAYDVGYESPSAFSNMFKRTLGMTPAEYRNHRLASPR
ncbi:AraC family transcriptional regulator [Luteimonas sp. R10]|uniref:AraC family transcriptional regulator n=1 Tax=Luteimonas sp. R10 TaxID=3108176 RepID=UPI0030862D4E|nr:helix-turn-helix transcriptional regulator [Luteimonas sp. R10]